MFFLLSAGFKTMKRDDVTLAVCLSCFVSVVFSLTIQSSLGVLIAPKIVLHPKDFSKPKSNSGLTSRICDITLKISQYFNMSCINDGNNNFQVEGKYNRYLLKF